MLTLFQPPSEHFIEFSYVRKDIQKTCNTKEKIIKVKLKNDIAYSRLLGNILLMYEVFTLLVSYFIECNKEIQCLFMSVCLFPVLPQAFFR